MSQSVDQQSLVEEHFGCLAEHWADLGVWCTLWTPGGQRSSPVPRKSSFWKVIWTHGQVLRNEIAQTVRKTGAETTEATLMGVPGLRVYGVPLDDRDPRLVLAVCCVDPHCDWGEDFARLCWRLEIDGQALSQQGRRQPRYTSGQVPRVVSLIRQQLEVSFEKNQRQEEVSHMTSQLAESYEELNLIYRVGANMRVTHRPVDHFKQLFEELSETTLITTLAVVLFDTEVLDPENRLIIGGEPIVDEAGVLRIADCLDPLCRKSNKALIVNDLRDFPQLDWASGWLERLMAVPVICNQTQLGLLLVLNQRGNREFNSTDERLLHSVVDRSAAYLENFLLYGDLNNLLMGLLHALVSSIDAKDAYTCGHSNRVALISKRIAEQSGVGPARAERIYLSGLLHDVGKIGISEGILRKPGRLTPEEMAEMQEHPGIGARILGNIKQLDDIVPGVMYHHEWLSGAGYPKGLTDEHIPWIAKVVGLADAFDAMTSGRTYRSALPLGAALAEIRRFAGTQFDPDLVDALVALVGEGLPDELHNVKTIGVFENVAQWTRSERVT